MLDDDLLLRFRIRMQLGGRRPARTRVTLRVFGERQAMLPYELFEGCMG